MNIDTLLCWEKVKAIALQLPETYEQACYGTPALYTGKNFFVRLRDDDETLALYTHRRDEWIAKNPETFFITDHYLNYPILLVNISKVNLSDLEILLIESWKIRAGKKWVKAYEAQS